MADVARQAGVSLSTVSYVLSGKRPISPITRERVLSAIEEVNFAPNAQGQALARRTTETIALLFPALAHDLSATNLEFVSGAVAAARERDYNVMISVSDDPMDEVKRVAHRGFADGVVLMEVELHDERIDLLQKRGFPFALIGHRETNVGVNFVDFDFADAVNQCVDHLVDLGHQQIALALATLPSRRAGYGPSTRAERAFLDRLAHHGLGGVRYVCDDNALGGHDLLNRLLRQEPGTTAIIANSANLAPGIIQAGRGQGLVVPDDLSLCVIAAESVAETATPALTGVALPGMEMGRIGADILIDSLTKGKLADPKHVLLRSALVVRQTSGRVGRARSLTVVSGQLPNGQTARGAKATCEDGS